MENLPDYLENMEKSFSQEAEIGILQKMTHKLDSMLKTIEQGKEYSLMEKCSFANEIHIQNELLCDVAKKLEKIVSKMSMGSIELQKSVNEFVEIAKKQFNDIRDFRMENFDIVQQLYDERYEKMKNELEEFQLVKDMKNAENGLLEAEEESELLSRQIDEVRMEKNDIIMKGNERDRVFILKMIEMGKVINEAKEEIFLINAINEKKRLNAELKIRVDKAKEAESKRRFHVNRLLSLKLPAFPWK